ncbi:hypothetical protein HYN56_21440 [Flavobacterium crocinum]|uniref:Uncharacterized protein n=1 Tax=Flavobacterium crocinum TaxID=2183896 RepID=A0A2S1YRJ8_9FLAO|nr:hypothetical protein [Flavobacterium crocinum]AWK06653.1 hypothetical protein HYN56_21440 [Flavobacterium crocinum]
MKKMILFIVIVVFVSVGIWYFKKKDTGIYEQNSEPIPSIYQTYQPISSAYRNSDFSVKEICSTDISLSASPNPIKAYQSVNGNLIIGCQRGNDDTTKGDKEYYKIDKNGLITDSIYVKYDGFWTVLIEGFMISTKQKEAYYTSWPSDGSTTQNKFQEHNADFAMPDEQLNIAQEKIRKESQYYFIRSYVEGNTFFNAFYYYINKQWNVLWQKTAVYQSEKDSENATRYQKELYYSGIGESNLEKDVELENFHKEDKIKYYHVIGGGAPVTQATGWRGTGFFKTSLGEKSFLFSVSKMVIEKEKFDGFQTRIYNVSEPKASVAAVGSKFYKSPFGFALYAPDARKMYLINSL